VTGAGSVEIAEDALVAVNGVCGPGGGVTVNSTGVLGGKGTVGGAVVVNTGGTVNPGASTGTLTVNNNIGFAIDSFFDVTMDSASDYDVLAVNGEVTLADLDGSAVLHATISNKLQSADALRILVNDGVDPIIGKFNDLMEGATVSLTPAGNVESATAKISYVGGTGNDITLYDFAVTMVFLLGDMDGSGAVNNNDITPFVMALTSPAQYAIDYPGMDPDVVGDIDGDGYLNNNDITPFVALLTSGPPVPEPATMTLLALGGLGMLRRRRE